MFKDRQRHCVNLGIVLPFQNHLVPGHYFPWEMCFSLAPGRLCMFGGHRRMHSHLEQNTESAQGQVTYGPIVIKSFCTRTQTKIVTVFIALHAVA